MQIWTGLGNLSLDGNTYTGAGDLLGISSVGESIDISARGATITLSGIPQNILADADAEEMEAKRREITLAIEAANVAAERLVGRVA